jgi:hypothetical protein
MLLTLVSLADESILLGKTRWNGTSIGPWLLHHWFADLAPGLRLRTGKDAA